MKLMDFLEKKKQEYLLNKIRNFISNLSFREIEI